MLFQSKCQIAKSNRWTCVFLLRVAINEASLISTQSFASFVYKIKHMQTERYDLLPQKSFRLWSKNVVPSQLITTAQKVVATK